jgi:hypothetical protein
MRIEFIAVKAGEETGPLTPLRSTPDGRLICFAEGDGR